MVFFDVATLIESLRILTIHVHSFPLPHLLIPGASAERECNIGAKHPQLLAKAPGNFVFRDGLALSLDGFNMGAVIIRIGYGGLLYCNHNKEPPK